MGITKTRSLRTHLTYMWFVSKKKKHTIFSLFYLNVMMLRLWSLCFFLLLLPWMGFMQINTTDGQLCLISILCGKSTNSQHCTAVNAVLNWRFFSLSRCSSTSTTQTNQLFVEEIYNWYRMHYVWHSFCTQCNLNEPIYSKRWFSCAFDQK